MAVKITATIDNISEADFDRFWRAWQDGPGARFEVMLDRIDGDHIETELHFRVVEEHPTQQIQPVRITLQEPAGLPPGDYQGAVERVHYRPGAETPTIELALSPRSADRIRAAEHERFPLRTVHVGGLGGKEPVMELPVVTTEYPAAELFMARASDLLAAMISLTKISPLVLGIPSGDEPLSVRLYRHLTGQEPA